jgi:hypothetical protein
MSYVLVPTPIYETKINQKDLKLLKIFLNMIDIEAL